MCAGDIARNARQGYVVLMSEEEKPEGAPERRRMVRPPSGGTAAGRGMGQKMKTADTKSMSSQQWIKRQLSDKWSEKARAEGWRSRAAFKLIEIDDTEKIFSNPTQKATEDYISGRFG